MKKIESIEQLEKIKQEENAVFLFTAGWCPDCTFIEPFLPELEEKHSDKAFYSINRDEFIEVCQDMDIFGIPSFVVFKDGKEVDRFVSKDRKTKEEIDSFLLQA
ncbi:thioredoxin family protein [Paenalkalicoccus suaedae]|uniref:Thioredoxin family protein n=1 Tax=Paenalkalicoccus suaedae TaxID=2592382 RepID=A0A859FFG2_9BACI|nr:thioredoxin family protein [Paenalkalicoccus suaedae]QKS72093.1 thioredoxin family protein [Paenalkalicoccus suaedae]